LPAVLLWVRVIWFAVGVIGAAVLSGVLADRSTPVAVVATGLAAIAWGAGIVAVLLPRSASLTVLRLLGVGAMLPAAAVDAFVDGSSYGPERRFALRTPAALRLGPIELAWLSIVGPLVVGPLLLAAGQWIGGVVLLAGVAATKPALRSLHQLSRRWVVFVPAGMVLHDPIVLSDAVLFPKRIVRGLGPAAVDSIDRALDVTGQATGLVLELQLAEDVTVAVREGRTQSRSVETDRLLFAAARPGAVLTEARQRGFTLA
jgi:hypothetical protein